VLDASAVLAYLGNERGAERVEEAIAKGVCLSTINWAEVLSKLSDRGQSVNSAVKELVSSGLIAGAIELFPFTADDSQTVGQLRVKTKRFGLSLADRACLALALRLSLPIITSDRSWLQLKLGIIVHSIR
jgi:PIN domain nuclease of toxin-antitoxin system